MNHYRDECTKEAVVGCSTTPMNVIYFPASITFQGMLVEFLENGSIAISGTKKGAVIVTQSDLHRVEALARTLIDHEAMALRDKENYLKMRAENLAQEAESIEKERKKNA